MTTTEFTIPATDWADFQADIAKLNRRAVKLGAPEITVSVLRHEKVTRKHTIIFDSTTERSREYQCDALVIELTGEAPRLNGWEFLARVEYLSDGASVLFHTVPSSTGATVDDRFRALSPDTCEHCNKRRRRTDTFIIRSVESGEQKQVGRQCLADFTGINDPRLIGAAASRLHTYEQIHEGSEHCWRGYFENRCDTLEALTLTSAYITLYGWVSRAAEGSGIGQATAGLVNKHYWFKADEHARTVMAKALNEIETNPVHAQRAGEVVAWIKGWLAQHARSDYEKNLVTLVVNDLTEAKHLGLVCSGVQAYLRHMEREAELSIKRKQLASSTHVGDVKQRLRNIAATITTARPMESVYGPSTLVKLVTVDGNVFTWFATGDRVVTPGTAVVFDGTVKAHKERDGIKETVLTRVALRK